MRSAAVLVAGQLGRVRPAVRRVAFMAILAAGMAAYPVAGAELGRLDGMAVSGGILPAGRGAGDFLLLDSLMRRLPPARLHIASSTTALTTIPITTPITGFPTPHRCTRRRHARQSEIRPSTHNADRGSLKRAQTQRRSARRR